jgi:hypothetical protein
VNRLGLLCAAGILAGGVFLSGQQISIPEPRRGSGDSLTGAFEGWFYNPDGSRSFLVGYYNRNSRQELDIPIGPNNRIEPSPNGDMGQPTHFMTGRQWGMFTVAVPREFKPTDKYVWSITANGETTQIPLRLNADYVMSPFTEVAANNTPPSIRFEQNGKGVQGPLAALASAPARTATAGTPLAVTIWVNDDMRYTSGTGTGPAANRPPVAVRWSKYRGPGAVTFEKANPEVEKISQSEGAFAGKATVSATFKEAGDYYLHVIVNDYSGDGGAGFGCCWSTGLVKVTVK